MSKSEECTGKYGFMLGIALGMFNGFLFGVSGEIAWWFVGILSVVAVIGAAFFAQAAIGYRSQASDSGEPKP